MIVPFVKGCQCRAQPRGIFAEGSLIADAQPRETRIARH
ncbi:hypothetical protein BN128_3875 [Cronobacter sakazakii 696]|nr:hypothetical protein BN128_3875 [Cronobacter sakazakii 696]